MRIRIASLLGALVALSGGAVAADAGQADRYPNYYAAVNALKRSDCDAVVDHLNAFLRDHPYVREKHQDFYLDIRLVMGQCSDRIRVRGIEGESPEIEPLPDPPPMRD